MRPSTSGAQPGATFTVVLSPNPMELREPSDSLALRSGSPAALRVFTRQSRRNAPPLRFGPTHTALLPRPKAQFPWLSPDRPRRPRCRREESRRGRLQLILVHHHPWPVALRTSRPHKRIELQGRRLEPQPQRLPSLAPRQRRFPQLRRQLSDQDLHSNRSARRASCSTAEVD